MKKHKAVVFEDGYATIYVSTDPLKFVPGPGVYIDPDLSAVKNVPPELWKEQDGRIVPITDLAIVKERMMVGESEAMPFDWAAEKAAILGQVAEGDFANRKFATGLVENLIRDFAKLQAKHDADMASVKWQLESVEIWSKKRDRLYLLAASALMVMCLLAVFT